MLYEKELPVRYPKSSFAMNVVYLLTSASVLTSIFFSLLLFLSIDDDWVMMALFGSLAIIFELGKFFAWFEFGERRARRNFSGALSALIFYAILAAISIGGSIGGINSATNTAQNHVNIQQSKIDSFNREIEAIEEQIELNNEAGRRYIEMNRIAIGLARIQKENSALRDKQRQLAEQRDSLPVVTQGSVLGLIDSMARALGTDSQTAKLWLVVFLSVLLDFFAAFFIGLIGEEKRFCQQFRHQRPVTIEPEMPKLLTHQPQPETESKSDTGVTTAADIVDQIPVNSDADKNILSEQEQALIDKVSDALDNKQVNCTKKAVMSFLKITQEETDALFALLMEQNLVSQKPNNHYRWHGNS
ncbi:Preprotein translocase subunit SecY [Oceanospirillum sediminis]|uniref:Preprotein translocase subunit SecY n=1 Tax=Oceanospirillum sediminis TaxID=2760088 RepID=A0A839IST3_9GAMM|nr:Preprotein translocase subunit SecY [Oceanospirillum sediminis]MBB1487740.1 Preprotein translocase subunit SecY [Oceanospirillum sediminis]